MKKKYSVVSMAKLLLGGKMVNNENTPRQPDLLLTVYLLAVDAIWSHLQTPLYANLSDKARFELLQTILQAYHESALAGTNLQYKMTKVNSDELSRFAGLTIR